MYSPQTISSYTASLSTVSLWAYKSEGWNNSSPQTHYNPSGGGFQASTTSSIVDIKVTTLNGTSFDRTDVTISPGTLLRFHLAGQDCSLIQAFSDLCANKSLAAGNQQAHTMEASRRNGSTTLDYLVDTDSPQWIYTVHSKNLCNIGQVFRINPGNGSGLAVNSTLSHTIPIDGPSIITSHVHEACNGVSAPTITSAGNMSSSTGITTNTSASRTLQQPFATSFAPELSNNGRKLIVHHLIVFTLLLSHVLAILSLC